MKNKIIAIVSSSNPVSSRGSRELQIAKALITSSSRLALELTVFKVLCVVLLLFSLSLPSQETIPANDYYFIKKLIEAKEIMKAKQEVQKALAENPHDPTLNLYQAEIWILEADSAYSNGNTARALQLYEEAVKAYPANPLVQMRLKELKSTRKVPISLVPNALIPGEHSIANSQELRTYETRYLADNNKQLLYTILGVQILILFFLAGLYRK